MARLVAAKCPNCGAALKLDPRSQWVTCTYCSTSSFIQVQGRPAPAQPTGPLIVVEAPRGPNPALIAIPIGVALALCAAGASVVAALSGQRRTSSVATPTGTATTTNPRTARSTPNPDSVSTSDRPLLTDVNSDGAPDAIVLVSRYENGATRTRLAALDGRSGEYRWTSEELGRSAHQLRNAIFEGALLAADDSGRLTGYRTSDGGKLWSIAIGDKVERFCGALTAGRARVRIQDESFEDVELSTGARHKLSGKPDCKPANTDERARELGHPRTWKSDVMPPEIESYGCGSTRFMGTWNFVLEDRCAPKLKVDTERVAEFRPGSIGRHGTGYLIVGNKSPGSRVPMAGFAQPGKLVWSSPLPVSEPLEFSEGSPSKLALAGDVVVLPYTYRSGSRARATAFQITSGNRLWDIELDKALGGRPEHLAASAESVFIVGNSALLALRLTDGKLRFRAGRSE
jgi:outer membrane protein assembly factor BamB